MLPVLASCFSMATLYSRLPHHTYNNKRSQVIEQCGGTTEDNFLEMLGIEHNATHSINVAHFANMECQEGEFTDQEIHEGMHNEISTCPWHKRNNTDLNRIPQHIEGVAECRCMSCRVNNEDGICKPYHTEITVLRRRCEGDQIRYYKSHESFPVACVCMPRRNIRLIAHNW